ncbi:MAG: di-trans,poly-cis-decaprenylcistransferase [Chloroflexi bacterium]|nr:di-trans,poly-cis-decaprenylcistransferase [Chloroflexota bacterium]
MDGNGRWAEQRGLHRIEGHRAGVENVKALIKSLNKRQIKYVTLYGFSTENWRRPQDEVDGLLRLLQEAIDSETEECHRAGIKLQHLGRLDGLSPGVQESISRAIELTRNNTGMVLNIAFNYGGRAEILDAVRNLLAGGVSPQSLDEELFSNHLYTAGLPDVDLMVRTGGEIRISNFLLWQAAYAEFYFTPVLWPDFDEKEIGKALMAFCTRQRRFGRVVAEKGQMVLASSADLEGEKSLQP